MDIGDIFSGIIGVVIEEIVAGAFDFYVILPLLLGVMKMAGGQYSLELDFLLWILFLIILIFPILYHIIYIGK